jgi:hypothetical protein
MFGKKIVTIILSMALFGCASMVVKQKDIEKKTALALGLQKSDFTISDRADDGLQTNYVVTTKTGKKYNCYVEGSFSFGTGGVVTDAICSEPGKPAKNPLQK